MEQLDLTSFFHTKAQATDFSARLGTVSQSIYETDFNLEKALMEQFGIQKKDVFMVLLRDNKVVLESNTALKAFFDKIQEAITSLPVLTLTVAFEPKEQTLKAWSEWCVLNVNQQLLFEIIVDTDVIAGAVISFKGKYLDMSVKPTLERILVTTLGDAAPPPAEAHTQDAAPTGHQSAEHMTFGR